MKFKHYLGIVFVFILIYGYAYLFVVPNVAISQQQGANQQTGENPANSITGYAVLGYNLAENDSQEILNERVNVALDNCNVNLGYVILTGGKEYDSAGLVRTPLDTDRTEAKEMEKIWLENNEQCNATLILEENSYNTYQNAYNTLKLAKEKNISDITVFTNKNHLIYAPFLFNINKVILFSLLILYLTIPSLPAMNPYNSIISSFKVKE